ncbi:hypothetical protein RB195_006507 [Necator americanus]|uniref:Uncharacterized protein n=1 Tax=Necator americanus TaxID=51031 RepID=A0ABR1BVQ7_NECAM
MVEHAETKSRHHSCPTARATAAPLWGVSQSNSGGNTGGWGDDSQGGYNDNNNNNNNNNNNYNGWGNNNNDNNADGEQSSRGSWGNSFAEPSRGSTVAPLPAGGRGFSPKQIEDRFKDFDVDDHSHGDGDEEVFEKVDVRFTTPSTRGDRRGSSSSDRRGSSSSNRQGSQSDAGREIELV